MRGRAGRQGDPGASRFFTSLEDELFTRYRIGESLIPYCYFPLQRIGMIDFYSRTIRAFKLDNLEDIRGKDVTADNGKVRGRILGVRLLDVGSGRGRVRPAQRGSIRPIQQRSQWDAEHNHKGI